MLLVKRGGYLSRVSLDNKETDKAFDELYQRYADSIYKFCLYKLNCDEHYAQDSTQETFLVLYKRIKQGEEFENPQAFIYRTALNFIRKRYDAIKKEQENLTQLDGNENIASYSESEIIEKLDFELLSKRLEKILNDKEKTLFQLRFKEDMSIGEIAQQLGITAANCSVRIMRLRKKIIAELQDYI